MQPPPGQAAPFCLASNFGFKFSQIFDATGYVVFGNLKQRAHKVNTSSRGCANQSPNRSLKLKLQCRGLLIAEIYIFRTPSLKALPESTIELLPDSWPWAGSGNDLMSPEHDKNRGPHTHRQTATRTWAGKRVAPRKMYRNTNSFSACH